MGALVGLLLGLGLLLVHRAVTSPAQVSRSSTSQQRMDDLLRQAGVEGVSPVQLLGASLGLGFVSFVLVAGTSQVFVIGLAFGLFAAFLPLAVVRRRRSRRMEELRELWPEAVDNLASGVRAGMALPEALSQLAIRGPEPLRPAFRRFGEDYRATGRFADCLDHLKADLADPVGDRVVEALRMAREVGGSDLGKLLRTLSTFLREDARTRAELGARQSWTVGAARLALAAPWALLLLLSTQPSAVAAYREPAGSLVLLVGGGVSFGAYRLMVRIARLPVEQRVLR